MRRCEDNEDLAVECAKFENVGNINLDQDGVWCCVHGNESSGFMKDGDYPLSLEQTSSSEALCLAELLFEAMTNWLHRWRLHR
jgi:hypothetical protein